MHIYSKELLLKKEKVIILGQMPANTINYYLMKRSNDFFLVNINSPSIGSNEVEKRDHIYKTSNFKNWQGSSIGSGYTRYDEQADAFFSITCGVNTSVNLATYHITKINPDDFSYTIKEMMPPTALSVTSRGITNVNRIGNELVILYYKHKTNVYSYRSTDNGNTWSERQLASIPSYGAGLGGLSTGCNGTKFCAYISYSTYKSEYRVFSSSSSSVKGTQPILYQTNSCYTKSPVVYGYDNNTKEICITKDFNSYTRRNFGQMIYLDYKGLSVYGDYLITTSIKSNSTLLDHMGKIIVHNLKTGQAYTFDPKLEAVRYYYSYRNNIKILGIIDDEVYFSFSKDEKDYFIAKMDITILFKEMLLYQA